MAYTIIENYLSASKYSLKAPNSMVPIGITVHNTANDASAVNEVAYMIGNESETSYHVAVDDKNVVLAIPFNRNAWHAGDGNGNGNRKTIGIEICYSKSGGTKFDEAEKNASAYIATLLKQYGWTLNNVYTHKNWSGKNCPHRTMANGWDRFKAMIQADLDALNGKNTTSAPTASTNTASGDPDIVFTYAVRIEGGKKLKEVKNLEDYAGIKGKRITDVKIKVNKGSVKYRVHVLGDGWLPYVTGCDWDDANNGYAGNGKVIDAIEVYYNTPADIVSNYGYQKAQYRVSPLNRDYYSWQFDNETSDGQDGYAGAFGKAIDRFQLW